MPTLAPPIPESHEPYARSGDEVASRRFGAARRVATRLTQPDVRNSFLALFDQAVVSGTAFATSILIGRFCSVELLGSFYLALTIVYVARDIQDHLICSPYLIYCQNRRNEALARYTGSSLLHQFALTAVVLAVLLGVLAAGAFNAQAAAVAPAIWVLLGVLPFLQLREFIRRLSIAQLQIATATVIDLVVAVLQIGGLALLAYTNRLSITAIYGVMAVACAAACLGWLLCKRAPMRFSLEAVREDWRHNWRFGRWAMVGHLLGFATAYLMPLILTLSCGKTGAGIWAACISIVGIASMFMTGLASYWLPRTANAFCQGGPDTLRRVMRNAGIIYAAALGLFALFVLATGDFLLVLAYGQKFAGNGAVIGVLAFNVFVTSLSLTVGMGLWAINRPDGNLPADTCCLVVTLAVAACLIPTWGVLGAAVGDTVGKLAGLLARQWTFRQLIDGATIPAAAH